MLGQAEGDAGRSEPQRRSCGWSTASSGRSSASACTWSISPRCRCATAAWRRSRRWSAGTIRSSAPLALALRPARRGAWPDRRADPMGPAHDPPAVARMARAGHRHLHRVQHFGAEPPASRLPRPGRAHVPRARRSDRPPGARADRGRDPAAGQADGHADPVPDQGHRPCDRRFRDRLFVADAASPAALHRGQDRPGVRRRRRRIARLPADHPDHQPTSRTALG